MVSKSVGCPSLVRPGPRGPESRHKARRSARSPAALLHQPGDSRRLKARRKVVKPMCYPGGQPLTQRTGAHS
eukprot:9258456-Pyramimonas_sp.AAC.1